MPKKLAVIVVVAILAMLAVGCNGVGGTADPIDLIPSDANVIAYLDLSTAMENEELLEQFFMPTDPESGQMVEDVLEIFEGLTEAWLFFDLSDTATGPGYGGVIVKGDFDESELIDQIIVVVEEELEAVDYEGHEILTAEDGAEALAVLGGDSFVIGTLESVKDVISVMEGDKDAIGGKVLSTFNSLSKADLRMAMEVPPGTMDDLLGEGTGGMGFELPGLESLADLDTIGLTLDDRGNTAALDVKMCFTSQESAEAVDELVDTLLVFVEMAAGESPELEELLNSIEKSVSGSCLTISIEISEAQFESIMEGFGGVSSGMGF